MTIFELTAILSTHNIHYRVHQRHVLMSCEEGNRWIDISGWSRLKLARWLQSLRAK